MYIISFSSQKKMFSTNIFIIFFKFFNIFLKHVQWSKPYSILAPTKDSNPGGWIQNHISLFYLFLCTGTEDKLVSIVSGITLNSSIVQGILVNLWPCLRLRACERSGQGVDSLMNWHGSHFWVCITFVRSNTVTASPSQIVVIRAWSGKEEVPVCYKKCIPWCGEIDGEARADGKKHPSLRLSTKGIARASRAQLDIDRGEHCGGGSLSSSPENSQINRELTLLVSRVNLVQIVHTCCSKKFCLFTKYEMTAWRSASYRPTSSPGYYYFYWICYDIAVEK